MCAVKKTVREYLVAVEKGPRHKEGELLNKLKTLTCQGKGCPKDCDLS